MRIPILAAGGPIIFRQFFEKVSSTYTYLLADRFSGDAVLIDPVRETVERDAKLVSELNLRLGPIINTHIHADHVSGSGLLKKKFLNSFSVIGGYDNAKADKIIKHMEPIKFGNYSLECRYTPGHTVGCITLVLHEAGVAFTGDTLLIRGCGRTDFQGGSAESLYDSVHSQIFTLPDDFLLFPAHNYAGVTVTSVSEEKRYNSRLTRTKAEFVEIMKNLNLDLPKQIDHSVPLNLVCGVED